MTLVSGDVHQVPLPRSLVGHRLSGAQHPNRLMPAVAGDLRRRHHDGPAAIGNHTAVGQMQRRGDYPGVDHVFHGDGVSEQCLGIHGSVMAHRHGNLRQLLRGGAVKVHVALGDHGIQTHGGQSVQLLKTIRRRLQSGMAEPGHTARSHRDAAGAGQAAVCDNGAVKPPGNDGVEGVGKMELERPSAHGGVIHEPGVHVQVVSQVQTGVAGGT